jgi:hypothetical protein
VSEGRPFRRLIVSAALALGGAAVVLGGLIWAGRVMRGTLQSAGRYQFLFKQIDCPTPPGADREQFLSEVRYYGEFPETVSMLDENLGQRLSEAFARHVWVERVDGVEITPNRRIQVKLTFREPVLAVVYEDRGPVVRAVDRHGTLLPRAVDTLSLPQLVDRAPQPANGIGRPWGDAQVEGAARVAALLRPHRARLRLNDFRWRDGDLWLKRVGGPEVIWGKPPEDDAVAQRKIDRLLEQFDKAGAKSIDLRRD